LISGCQSGDKKFFSRIYELYFQKIYNYIYFKTYHKETAEDGIKLSYKIAEKVRTEEAGKE